MILVPALQSKKSLIDFFPDIIQWYGVYRNDDDSLTDTVTISQNEAGIDTEDRIIKLKKYIANMK